MHALLTLLLQRCCYFALDDPKLSALHCIVVATYLRCCCIVVVNSLSTFPSCRRCIVVATTQNRCQEAPKSTPGDSKIDTRRCQNRAKIAQGGQGASQERRRSAQERTKIVQERPRAHQERPKSLPRAPKSDPRAPKSAPRAAQERPETSQSTTWSLRSSKNATFEGDPLHDSVEKLVRNDFRSIFASCAQARTCEKPIKTLGFYRFSTSRHLCERVG